MKPKSSNLPKEKCIPISAHCVQWDGRDLPVIGVCKGDSISDITYKLAVELEKIQDALDLSDLDLKCIFDKCNGCPDPVKSLVNVLQWLINKACETVPPPPATPPITDGPITLPPKLREPDKNGDPVGRLPFVPYVETLARHLSNVMTNQEAVQSTLGDHEARIIGLEEQEVPEVVYPEIQSEVIGGNGVHPLEEVLAAIDAHVAEMREVTGDNTDLADVRVVQPASLNAEPALSVPGTMSGFSNWASTVNTVADSLKNLWLTVLDMRAAMVTMKQQIQPDCSQVNVDFLATLSSDGNTLTLYFRGYSSVPTGFTDCDEEGSELTITDLDGNTFAYPIILSDALTATGGVAIDLSESPLLKTSDLAISLVSCLGNGSVSCTKTIQKTVVNQVQVCPTFTASPTETTIAFVMQPPITENITYYVDLMDATGTNLIIQKSYENPSALITDSFGDVAPGTSYKIRISALPQSMPLKVCQLVSVTTPSVEG